MSRCIPMALHISPCFMSMKPSLEQDGQLQRGNTLLRSQVIELQGRFYTVTVAGEIPGALARFVLGGIRQQSVIERGE